jgi:hypothetical protein
MRYEIRVTKTQPKITFFIFHFSSYMYSSRDDTSTAQRHSLLSQQATYIRVLKDSLHSELRLHRVFIMHTRCTGTV